MRMRGWLIAITLLAAVVALSLAAARHFFPGGSSAGPNTDSAEAASGEQTTLRFYRNPVAVPPTKMQDLDGNSISSSDWQGKVTIVNFWATWCLPCRAEIPDLIALQKKYPDHLQIIGVSDDEGPPEDVKRFAKEHHINYPIVMSTPEIKKAFAGVNALPTSFILDREVRIVQKHIGLLNAAVTEQELRALAGLSVNSKIEEVDRW